MRKVAASFVVAGCLLTPAFSVQAAEPAPAAPAAPEAAAQPAAPAKPAKASPATARSDAAEARYRAWSESEHAKDAAVFAKEKSKIEDKYKGYVRPKREKKDAKAESVPAKGN
ncbi:hypothetical protein [Solidesulfovibrio sp.]|uniref:hypothetical protein n=1 Tax=Solidesulfovibrio sp. TaxID=2910990 RepID=UPI00263582F9|nr:hypothetical protein [Solidesulfovibrio sp.]